MTDSVTVVIIPVSTDTDVILFLFLFLGETKKLTTLKLFSGYLKLLGK